MHACTGGNADAAYAAGYEEGYSDGYDEGEVACENNACCPAPVHNTQFIAAEQVEWMHANTAYTVLYIQRCDRVPC
jgi:hypothetical protein